MKLKAAMGLSEIALMTINANTYSDIFPLVERLSGVFDRGAIKSQRFDAVVNSPELLDLQFDVGKRTYTCAMEGISERIRTLLQKNLDENTILTGIDLLVKRDMRQMKVFLILSGYEDDSDLNEFSLFLDKVRQKLAGGNSRPKLTFSFAVLFRAPQTPMQYAGKRMPEKEMRSCLEKLQAIVRSAGFEARVSAGCEDAIVSEYIAFADRRHTPVLVEASISASMRYRGEISRKLLEFWRDRLLKNGLEPLCEIERDEQTVFPWDDVDTGINRQFLAKVWNNLSAGKEIRACISMPWGDAKCAGCGACSSSEEIKRLNCCGPAAGRTLRRPLPTKLSPVKILVRIPEKWAFADREFIKAAIGRRLMLNSPDLVEPFRRIAQIAPEFFSSGFAVAVAMFADIPLVIPDKELRDDDISVVAVLKSAGRIEEMVFPMEIEGRFAAESSLMAREIDAMLSHYRLKNLKQRQNGWINWQINSGQAKKAGIDLASLHEERKLLRLKLIRMPELHLLNKLFPADAPVIIASCGHRM
jgi:hypothetical protein